MPLLLSWESIPYGNMEEVPPLCGMSHCLIYSLFLAGASSPSLPSITFLSTERSPIADHCTWKMLLQAFFYEPI